MLCYGILQASPLELVLLILMIFSCSFDLFQLMFSYILVLKGNIDGDKLYAPHSAKDFLIIIACKHIKLALILTDMLLLYKQTLK